LTVTVLFFWGVLSDERTGLSFYMLLALASVVFLRSESLSTRDQSQSQSYVTTDGLSASLSWNKAPIWGLRPDLYYCAETDVNTRNIYK
jgi:hypothetical protein